MQCFSSIGQLPNLGIKGALPNGGGTDLEAIALDLTIPQPNNADDEDVHWALSTATTLWSRGDRAESLKWLRRAASSASDCGHDMRALELFKAGADVASLLQQDATAAPPTQPVPTPAESGVGLRQPTTALPSLADCPTRPLADPAPPVRYNDLEEVTAVIAGCSQVDLQAPSAPVAIVPKPANRNGAAVRRPIRVAVVTGADGQICLLPLTTGKRPPRGAALATLTPTSPRDAKLIDQLFDR